MFSGMVIFRLKVSEKFFRKKSRPLDCISDHNTLTYNPSYKIKKKGGRNQFEFLAVMT